MMVTVRGSSAAPLANAPRPRICCRYRFTKKNIGIQAAPSSSCATLAAARSGAQKAGEVDVLAEVLGELVRDGHGEGRLARATGPDEADRPLQRRGDLRHVVASAGEVEHVAAGSGV